jgi:hypothetical protein
MGCFTYVNVPIMYVLVCRGEELVLGWVSLVWMPINKELSGLEAPVEHWQHLDRLPFVLHFSTSGGCRQLLWSLRLW